MISRFFNKLILSDNTITKKFVGNENLKYTMNDEISYYKKIRDPIFPKIIKYFDNGYEMEYLKNYKPFLLFVPGQDLDTYTHAWV